MRGRTFSSKSDADPGALQRPKAACKRVHQLEVGDVVLYQTHPKSWYHWEMVEYINEIHNGELMVHFAPNIHHIYGSEEIVLVGFEGGDAPAEPMSATAPPQSPCLRGDRADA